MYDCPAKSWMDFTSTGDLSLLIRKGGSAEVMELESAADKIRDELFEKFGFPEDLNEYLEELRAVELLRCEWILSDNDSVRKQKEMWMEIHEAKADSIVDSGAEADVEDIMVRVERDLGREIDLREISIYKFRSYTRALSNGKKNN